MVITKLPRENKMCPTIKNEVDSTCNLEKCMKKSTFKNALFWSISNSNLNVSWSISSYLVHS